MLAGSQSASHVRPGAIAARLPQEPLRCSTCRTKIVVPAVDGLVVKNAILHVSAATGKATAKCPRCKSWVEVPLAYHG